MVLSFFRSGSVGLDHVVTKAVTMLGDARHSFDLATNALLSGGDVGVVSKDIRETDQRINQAERELRSELVVHVSVQGSTDIGEVLGLILLLKKIERIGDQAKNILDLAESGVVMGGDPDAEILIGQRQIVSALFQEAAELLAEHDDLPEEFLQRGAELGASLQAEIDSYLQSDRPGHEVVPRAIYARYLKRIVANLLGVVRSATEPIAQGDDNADDYGDLDD
ncbi:MAG: PhoU domain-containing protein [Actinomycetia bacterium]|nr:PhoU domain-containing protein [Actinomycetes bacterium]MCP4957896.1 PhoU domain-containing protein [Actinomycetes bacterium]